jgi:hypothetical protein
MEVERRMSRLLAGRVVTSFLPTLCLAWTVGALSGCASTDDSNSETEAAAITTGLTGCRSIGLRLSVVTQGNLRAAPGNTTVLETEPAGSSVTLIASCPTAANSASWYNVSASGTNGWLRSDHLQPFGTLYSVVGREVVNNNTSAVYVPYGLIVEAEFSTGNFSFDNLKDSVIQDMNQSWNANVLRLNVSSQGLFNNNPYPGHNATYLGLLDHVIQVANANHMNVVLSLQYEVTTKQKMPTQDSIDFWNFVAPYYAGNEHVIFDVYNESVPNDVMPSGANLWDFWQNGGVGKDRVTYIGMQRLVDTIRNSGAKNLLIVQGPSGGDPLGELSTHMMVGNDITYAFHSLNWGAHPSLSEWQSKYGDNAININAPIFDEAMSEYESGGNCWTDAPQWVPQELQYMHDNGFGLMVWGFVPGTMVHTWDMSSPTSYGCNATFPYTSACQNSTTVCDPNVPAANAHGSGQDVKNLFSKYARSW